MHLLNMNVFFCSFYCFAYYIFKISLSKVRVCLHWLTFLDTNFLEYYSKNDVDKKLSLSKMDVLV